MAEVPVRIHGRDEQVMGLEMGKQFKIRDTSSSACKFRGKAPRPSVVRFITLWTAEVVN